VTEIPQWAVDAVKELHTKHWAMHRITSKAESLDEMFARALAAEREAATMAERERIKKVLAGLEFCDD